MRISDLALPVTAAKSHWTPGGLGLEFTPANASTNARAICESAVNRQANNGYILDYITQDIEIPNPGFESDPEYLRDLQEHQLVAGRLIAVHRLRPALEDRSARSWVTPRLSDYKTYGQEIVTAADGPWSFPLSKATGSKTNQTLPTCLERRPTVGCLRIPLRFFVL